MTVIAYRDGVMAADSRVTGNFITAGIKLHRKNGKIIGFAGDLHQALVFIDWYFDNKQRKPDLSNENDWVALVASPDGVEEWNHSLRPFKVMDSFYAIGSGAEVAIGAMEAGASAKKAAEIACKRADGCGLPVVTMRVK